MGAVVQPKKESKVVSITTPPLLPSSPRSSIHCMSTFISRKTYDQRQHGEILGRDTVCDDDFHQHLRPRGTAQERRGVYPPAGSWKKQSDFGFDSMVLDLINIYACLNSCPRSQRTEVLVFLTSTEVKPVSPDSVHSLRMLPETNCMSLAECMPRLFLTVVLLFQ